MNRFRGCRGSSFFDECRITSTLLTHCGTRAPRGRVAAYYSAIELFGQDAVIWNDLGSALKLAGRSDEALMGASQNIELAVDLCRYFIIGHCRRNGAIFAARKAHRSRSRLIRESSGFTALLYTLYFAEGMTKPQLIAEHREYAALCRSAEINPHPHANSPEPGRQPRVWGMCRRISWFTHGRFILRFSSNTIDLGFEIFVYSGVGTPTP